MKKIVASLLLSGAFLFGFGFTGHNDMHTQQEKVSQVAVDTTQVNSISTQSSPKTPWPTG
ncbi:hypothetical protein JK635_07745 [Neobacillus sp. YIM B02564]|uniref:Phr family secreted Rap phosphatase inhibitor n=1 Tax=Neobacillus paridis TaxID=2803862 RepID=A0ABS1TLD0_9BACI|nr:hypothetical protein [Neobacillus paridis]MBL4952102.1 hypothetical protein [Neobacillus paridis]